MSFQAGLAEAAENIGIHHPQAQVDQQSELASRVNNSVSAIGSRLRTCRGMILEQAAGRVTEDGVNMAGQLSTQSHETDPLDLVLRSLWQAIHHQRTIFGRKTYDLRSFFSAVVRLSSSGGFVYESFVTGIMQQQDNDGSRIVTRSELRKALQRLDVPVTSTQLESLLDTIDTDHSVCTSILVASITIACMCSCGLSAGRY